MSAGKDEVTEAFVHESNRIEGIDKTTGAHIAAHLAFLDGPIHIPKLIELVSVLQPNARFRNQPQIPGVRVGNHIAPPSGPDIEDNLRSILAMRDPWEQHIAYETLHPFTDGNGRSGRAIWLHRHYHEHLDDWAIRRGFLHSWYYHTLSSVRLGSQAARTPNATPSDELVEAVRTRRAWAELIADQFCVEGEAAINAIEEGLVRGAMASTEVVAEALFKATYGGRSDWASSLESLKDLYRRNAIAAMQKQES